MCWSIPGKIVEMLEDQAVVDIAGTRKTVALDLIDNPKKGEYVLVHAGYAIQKVDEERAQFTLDFFAKGAENKRNA